MTTLAVLPALALDPSAVALLAAPAAHCPGPPLALAATATTILRL